MENENKYPISQKHKSQMKDYLLTLISNTPKFVGIATSIGIILSVIVAITFQLTYMQEKQIFSFEIFSLSNSWLWIVAAVYFVSFLGAFSFQFAALVYTWQNRQKYKILYTMAIISVGFEILLFTLLLISIVCTKGIDFSWLVFIAAWILVLFYLILYLFKYTDTKDKKC